MASDLYPGVAGSIFYTDIQLQNEIAEFFFSDQESVTRVKDRGAYDRAVLYFIISHAGQFFPAVERFAVEKISPSGGLRVKTGGD